MAARAVQRGLRVELDRRAVCTVSNCTSLVRDLRRRKVRRLLLVTSGYHLPRAMGVARIVFGAESICVVGTAVEHPHAAPPAPETRLRCLRWA